MIKSEEKLSPSQEKSKTVWSDQKFLSWLRSNGICVNEPPSEYSDGGVGRSYFLGDKVIKFTNNRVEANVANMVVGDYSSPTRVLGVYRFKPDNLWAILQKKVNINLPKMFKIASDILMAYIDEKEITSFPKGKLARLKIAKEAIAMFNKKERLIPYLTQVIDMLDNLYKKTGYYHDDAVPQNLGVDDGNLVVIDLGPNQTKTFNARKALDNIHDQRSKLGLPPIQEI
jgi:hypothetical protein